MTGLRFTPAAVADLDGIGDHVAANDPPAAARLIGKIRHTCRTIAEQPNLGRLRPELGPELRSLAVGAYVVFYRNSGAGVEILRVIHGARDLKRQLS